LFQVHSFTFVDTVDCHLTLKFSFGQKINEQRKSRAREVTKVNNNFPLAKEVRSQQNQEYAN